MRTMAGIGISDKMNCSAASRESSSFAYAFSGSLDTYRTNFVLSPKKHPDKPTVSNPDL